MTNPVSQSARRRDPVYSGNRRVRGLWQRTLADGTVTFETRLRVDGDDKRVLLEATTKTDAIREHESVRVDRDRGEQRHRSLAPTLDELADEWLEHLQSRVGVRDERRRYSQRTVDLYRQRLDDHVLERLGSRRVNELTVDDVRRMVERLSRKGLAPGSVTSCVNILSGLMRYALKRRLVRFNPVRDLDRDDRPGSKRQTEPRYLSAGELDQLLAQLSDTFRPVVYVCLYAGLRISEALGLRWADIDLKAGTISVDRQLAPTGERVHVKTAASAATLTMLPVLRRELVAHRDRQAGRNLQLLRPDALAFATSRGKPQSRRNALRAIHKAGDNAGLNPDGAERVGLHDLRHSLVALSLERGATVAEVAEIARHANPKVTMTLYAGLTKDGSGKAAAKLLESGFGK
jgi:integrase